jgi:hypothetical protein
MAAGLSPITAPIDFMCYHDCPALGLRVLEVRPGLVQHDLTYLHPELMALTDTGIRPLLDKENMHLLDRMRRNLWRQRRKFRAATSFAQTWGPGGMVRVLSHWPPGGYFR